MRFLFTRLSAGIVGMMFMVSACASSQSSATPGGTANGILKGTPNGGTVAATSTAIAAMVNNQPILLATLDQAVARGLEGLRSIGQPVPADMNAYRLTILDSLIDQVLIEQAAGIQHIIVTDADVETELQTNIKLAGSPDKWQAQLNGNGMSEAEYRAALRSALITQKMRDLVTKSTCLPAEQVHARHILVTTEALAKDIKSKIDAGATFAQLAAQYSLDVTTKQTGGDLGWFARGQLLQKAVEDSAFALPINQVSDPVKSDLGYHIIQTLEHVKNRPIDPDTCYKLTEQDFEVWIQGLATKATIQKFPNGRT